MIEGSSAPTPSNVKPRLRGVLHEAAFFVALVVGVLLVIYASMRTARAPLQRQEYSQPPSC
jgi:hypothetical protein